MKDIDFGSIEAVLENFLLKHDASKPSDRAFPPSPMLYELFVESEILYSVARILDRVAVCDERPLDSFPIEDRPTESSGKGIEWVAYLSTSPDDIVHTSISRQRQRALIRHVISQLAFHHLNPTARAEYIDALEAGDDFRIGLSALLEEVASETDVRYVFVESVSRLGTSFTEIARILKKVHSEGLTLVVANTGNLDMTSKQATEIIINQLDYDRAERDRRTLSDSSSPDESVAAEHGHWLLADSAVTSMLETIEMDRSPASIVRDAYSCIAQHYDRRETREALEHKMDLLRAQFEAELLAHQARASGLSQEAWMDKVIKARQSQEAIWCDIERVDPDRFNNLMNYDYVLALFGDLRNLYPRLRSECKRQLLSLICEAIQVQSDGRLLPVVRAPFRYLG